MSKQNGCALLPIVEIQAWWPGLTQDFRERHQAQLTQWYGPTEAAISVTSWTCPPSENERVEMSVKETAPIGRPIANAQLYLLDQAGLPVPVGVEGEVYLGGVCLARGYLGRADLTAERFVPHPWSEQPGARLYRTGDRARWMASGQLVFLGRRDQQVKLRGIRIELSEIEAVLLQHPAVRKAVVVAAQETTENAKLRAYLVLRQRLFDQDDVAMREDPRQGIKEIGSHVRRYLPEPMVPSSFVLIDRLPRLPNGKLDRQTLLNVFGRPLDVSKTSARTPIEEVLVGLWVQLLKLERVGIDENFFEVGGHSLLATRLVARVRAVFDVEIPLRAVFEAPTVAGLAVRVGLAQRAREDRPLPLLRDQPRPAHIPLSFAQSRLWFLDQFEPTSTTYLIPGAFRLLGAFDIRSWEESMRILIGRHESLRTTFEERAGEAVQMIHPVGRVPQPLIDLQGIGQEAQGWQARWLAEQEAGHPMTLSRSCSLAGQGSRISSSGPIALIGVG